jgi:hypothetical protein
LDLPSRLNRCTSPQRSPKMASRIILTKDEFRLLTWSRPELSRMTIQPQSLQRHCPLDNDRLLPHNAKTPTSLSNFGVLETLPPEIIHSILKVLDLQSLTDFRRVSWCARALVDSIPPYNAIVQHSPDALRALLSTHMAVHFTAQDIFEALCKQACVGCGQFGPLLDMFTAHRFCITCVAYSDNSLSMTTSCARREFGLDSKTMHKLPTLFSIPGQYSEGERMYRRRISLVRMLSVRAARSQHYESNAFGRKSGLPQRPLPQQPQLPPPPISHRLLPQRDGHKQNPHRFMAMLRFPSLDRRTGNLDWGVSCQACRLGPRDTRRGYRDWNIVYSAPGYMEHFQKCEMSQRGKAGIPGYVDPDSGDQGVSDARFLAFLSNLKF